MEGDAALIQASEGAACCPSISRATASLEPGAHPAENRCGWHLRYLLGETAVDPCVHRLSWGVVRGGPRDKEWRRLK